MSKSEYKKQLNKELSDYLLERAQEQKEKENNRKAEKVTLGAAGQIVFMKEFERLCAKVFKGKVAVNKAPPKSKSTVKRIVNLLLSDTHYGSNTDGREVKIAYGPVEEARRTAKVILETCNYKRQYRKETSLNLFLGGDMINGSLHDPRDGAPVAEQCTAALGILVQAIAYLSKEFPSVNVFCCSGNHGRRKDRHHQRAVNQKFDSLETILYSAVKIAFRDCKNVAVHIPYTPYITYQAFDKRGFVSHGDSVFSIGYPGSSINVKSIKNQINTINAAAGRKGAEFDLFAFGHVHTGSVVHTAGSTMITNGALPPPDAYAESIGIFDSSAGQYLWESVPGHIFGDSRYIKVSEKDDRDASLDKIIKPYSGL